MIERKPPTLSLLAPPWLHETMEKPFFSGRIQALNLCGSATKPTEGNACGRSRTPHRVNWLGLRLLLRLGASGWSRLARETHACFEILGCVNLVPKICVESKDFRKQRSMGGSRHADARWGGGGLPCQMLVGADISLETGDDAAFFFLFVFLGLHPWHMEVPRLGAELELHLPAYTTAIAAATSKPCLQPTSQLMAMPDPSPTERGQDGNCVLHGCYSDLFPLSHNGNSNAAC